MKLGLLICSYNRPEYLERCLQSVSNALKVAFAQNKYEIVVLIVDDHSTDVRVGGILHYMADWAHTWFMPENKSIKNSLLKGCDSLFNTFGCDLVTNLDADAIVRRDFISVLMNLREKFSEHIITGFNCLTKNRDGSERHKVLMHGDGFNLKQSVGGLNMLFDKSQYDVWIKPALIHCLQTQGNWDHLSCIASMAAGRGIISAVPSVVQHIGINSAMGHSLSEPPDVADDFSDKLKLPMVTLVGVDCVNAQRLINAVDISCRDIEFGDVKIFSNISGDHRMIKIQPIVSKSQYSEFMMKSLAHYIVNTSHVLVIQHDGFVLNADAWRDKWLEYDFIGAPWRFYDDGHDVGNGGFSLRSKRLHDILASDEAIVPIKHPGTTVLEDHCIGRIYRTYLEDKYSIKFAPALEAEKFSIEAWGVPPPGNKYKNNFGFHGLGVDFCESNIPYVPYRLPNRNIL